MRQCCGEVVLWLCCVVVVLCCGCVVLKQQSDYEWLWGYLYTISESQLKFKGLSDTHHPPPSGA